MTDRQSDLTFTAEQVREASAGALAQLGFDPESKEDLVTAAAIGAAHRLWRNTSWEDLHTEVSGLRDAEMMRVNSATVKLLRRRISTAGTDWYVAAAEISSGSRTLPDGRPLRAYAGSKFKAFRQEVIAEGRALEAVEDRGGPIFCLQILAVSTLFFGADWHGMPRWGAKVRAFCDLLAHPDDSFWATGYGRHIDPKALPAGYAGPIELRDALLRGPDTLSAEAASWVLQGGLQAP